jgi:hypothetical protein
LFKGEHDGAFLTAKRFEKEEDRLFGDEGFEKTVAQVATIEKKLGTYDLAEFTPK